MSDFRHRYGPVAFVTGASSGIGLAFATELAERGLDVVLVARRRERLENLGRAIEQAHGVKVHSIVADLSDSNAPATLLEATRDLDVGLVVSNAGFNSKGRFEQGSASRMAKLLTVNCHAPMQLAHGFIPRLKARGRGGFIATASVEGLMSMPYSTAYSATKALVVSLCEGLWAELKETGVNVLALCPGATESEATMGEAAGVESRQQLMPAKELVRQALDHIADGPTYVAREHLEGPLEALLKMPRRDALLHVEQTMRGYMTASGFDR